MGSREGVWTMSQLPQQLLHTGARREADPREGTFGEPKAGPSIHQRRQCVGGRLPGLQQAPPSQGAEVPESWP